MTFSRALLSAGAGLALVPGASRSGMTITAGLLQGLDRESAARFSFLLCIPAITGAGLYKLVKVVRARRGCTAIRPSICWRRLWRALFAYVVVRWFMGYMKEHNTGIFIAYRILFGLAILGLFHSGILHEHKVEEPKTSAAAAGAVGQNTPMRGSVKRI